MTYKKFKDWGNLIRLKFDFYHVHLLQVRTHPLLHNKTYVNRQKDY